MYITIKEDSVYEKKKIIFWITVLAADGHAPHTGISTSGGSQETWNGEAVKHQGY